MKKKSKEMKKNWNAKFIDTLEKTQNKSKEMEENSQPRSSMED